jgi:hypothetical protein
MHQICISGYDLTKHLLSSIIHTSCLHSTKYEANCVLRLQEDLNLIEKWLRDWRIKVNETKSICVIYTLRRTDCPRVYINNVEIPRANVAKYLGLHLDSKMTWKDHITKKKKKGEGYKT